jgi:hypothetical protein
MKTRYKWIQNMARAYLDNLKSRMNSICQQSFFKQLLAPIFSFVFLQVHLSLDAFAPFHFSPCSRLSHTTKNHGLKLKVPKG